MLSSSTPAALYTDASELWKALHATERLAIHAAVYTSAAGQIPPGCVLDLGCEYGFGSALISETNPRLKVLGMDLDLSALRYVQDMPFKARTPRLNADAFKLPFASESFSGVYLVNLLNLLEEPAGVLSEARRVLKPGGMAIISTPPDDLPGSGPGSSPSIRELDAEMEALFSEVFYPNEIYSRLPSFPPQVFLLNGPASTQLAFCRRS